MERRVPAHRLPRPIGDGLCEIELTHGKVALIDEIDAERLSVCCWFAHLRNKKPSWYATGRPVKGKKPIRMHRFILGLLPDDKRQVDHISGDVADNRRCNLRICTNAENNRNRKTALGAVPFKGVTLGKFGFVSSLTVNERRKVLGTFPTALEAALAYDSAAIEMFGEFAATNASLGLIESELVS